MNWKIIRGEQCSRNAKRQIREEASKILILKQCARGRNCKQRMVRVMSAIRPSLSTSRWGCIFSADADTRLKKNRAGSRCGTGETGFGSLSSTGAQSCDGSRDHVPPFVCGSIIHNNSDNDNDSNDDDDEDNNVSSRR